MSNANRVLSKMQILDHVWDYDFRGDTGIVEVLRLGAAAEDRHGGEPRLIHNPARRRVRAAAPVVVWPGPWQGRHGGGGQAEETGLDGQLGDWFAPLWSPWGAGKRLFRTNAVAHEADRGGSLRAGGHGVAALSFTSVYVLRSYLTRA